MTRQAAATYTVSMGTLHGFGMNIRAPALIAR
jgi:hypothetical protein